MAKSAKGVKKTFKLIGGPWDGKTIKLYEPGTLTFNVKSFDLRTGRYVDKGGYRNTLTWEFI
ncbi:hypothetical protein OMDBNIEC_00009 [Salmonella phage STP-SP5]|nr:hypothetical protein OMDBNIEC_00009 [Salmonella phage STP-SP5]